MEKSIVKGRVQEMVAFLRENIQRLIVGKDDAINLAIIALLSKGHVLIEDVPGIGKTTLSKALAQSLGCSFSRIQFTPDVMPTDVLGFNFFNQKSGDFEFRPGPIFSQVVLADEINRATPRTQSSLLEAMQERQATVDGITRPIDEPFMVLATQNPIEMEGTFPLPEAQLDRFMVRVKIGYPTEAEAVLLVELDGSKHGMNRMESDLRVLCERRGALSFTVAQNESERARLWLGRKAAFGAMGRMSTDLYVQDGVVPRSRLPSVLVEIGCIADRHQIRVANVFHAGDGNLHPCIPYDGRDSDERERVLAAGREILELCVAEGGSISGEHGIGTEKANYMDLLFSEADLGLMQALRDVWNPRGLLNPGKLFPTAQGCGESMEIPSVASVPGAWI